LGKEGNKSRDAMPYYRAFAKARVSLTAMGKRGGGALQKETSW